MESLDHAWEVLRAAGVPDGPARPASPVRLTSRALAEAVARVLDGSEVEGLEPLHAWLRAFAHEYAPRFARVLGPTGERALARTAGFATDPNRYLKLRRIAVARLALLELAD